MDFFLLGQLKEHVYAVHPRTIEDLVEGLEAVVTTVDVNIPMRARQNAVWRTAV
jgi:hypothetical protein